MKIRQSPFHICLLVVVLLLPAVAQAQFTFITNNGAITITGYTGSNAVVVIPDTTNGYLVVSIGSDAFFGQSIFASVTIPNSVTNIDNYAFDSYIGLTSVNIPDSVTSIGAYAFAFCSNLTNVTVAPNNLNYSSMDGILFDVRQGTLIQFPGGLGGPYTIPDGVANIGYAAFDGCSGLTSVTLPESVTNIGSLAFDACSGLTNITVAPNNRNFSSVGGVLFDLSQGTLIQFPGGLGGNYAIPNTVSNIGNYAFQECSKLTSVTIPDGVTSVSDYEFFDCYVLTNITIPNSVTSIGSTAFSDCGVLTQVIIPDRVTSIGSYAFAGDPGLTTVTIPDGVTSIGGCTFDGCSSLTNVIIGSGVTNIGGAAFQSCRRLKTVVIGCPDVGNWFAGLPITSVTILNTVTNIGANAFTSCQYLTNIIIGKGVASIGTNAFNSCYALSRVSVPGSVTSIGSAAFSNCTGLNGILFAGNAPSVDSSAFDADYATVYYLPGATNWGTTFGGLPAFLWNPEAQTGDASFGIRTNRFGFNVMGSSNLVIEVEASTNLVDWQVVQTKMLIGGKAYFSDPQWTNYSGRFYRFDWQ